LPRGPAYFRRFVFVRTAILTVAGLMAAFQSGCEDPPPSRSELDAIAAIQRVHGHVGLDNKTGHAVLVDFRRSEVKDGDLKPLSDLPYLQRLNLDFTGIGDEGMTHLDGLKSLAELSLRGTKVTDAGLVHLQHCSSLRELSLENLPITDAGLIKLGPIKSLHKVYVGPGGPITSPGVDALKAEIPSVSVLRK
jgi:hypothetical protein